MFVGRVVCFLLDHATKIGIVLLSLGGLIWLLAPAGDPQKALHARCREQHLPMRIVNLEPGSDEESKFLLMVPGPQRERVGGGAWLFCRANLMIVPREPLKQ
jgi:hypothetical protein